MKHHTLIITAILIGLGGCAKKNYPATESTSESVRYVEREVVRTVLDTVPVVIEIPAQSAETVTHDTVSRLETQFAESFAMWSGGMLTHRLENKPTRVIHPVVVPRTESLKQIEHTDSVKIIDYIYIEKPPSIWTRIRLSAFWWLVSGLIFLLIFVFRRQLSQKLLIVLKKLF